MKKKFLFGVMSAMTLGMACAGCASSPKVFETAKSLAGTQWGRLLSDDGDLVEFQDATSGVYTDV